MAFSLDRITNRQRTIERSPNLSAAHRPAVNAHAMFGLPPASPIDPVTLTSARLDCTSKVDRIMASLTNAYHSIGKQIDGALDRIYQGSHNYYTRVAQMKVGAQITALAADESGAAPLRHLIAFTLAGAAGFGVAAGLLGTAPLTLTTFVTWWASIYLSTFYLTGFIDNHSQRYAFKRVLFPVALTLSVFTATFALKKAYQVDNWVEIPLLIGGTFLGNVVRNLFSFLAEPSRHSYLNDIQNYEVQNSSGGTEFINKGKEMDEVTRGLKILQEQKWDAQQSGKKFDLFSERQLRHLTKRLAELVKEVRGFRFPSFFKMAVYQTARILPSWFYVPLALLFYTRGYDLPTAGAFTSFWVSQLIYTPTGKSFMEHMEIGDLTEHVIFGDLPRAEGKLDKQYLKRHILNFQKIWDRLVKTGYLDEKFYNDGQKTGRIHGIMINPDGTRTSVAFTQREKDQDIELNWEQFQKDFGVIFNADGSRTYTDFTAKEIEGAFYVLEQNLPMEEQPLPETIHFRLSNRGTYDDHIGEISAFLFYDILNAVMCGFKVKIALDNDPHNFFYPEVAGSVANANYIGARAQMLWKFVFPRLPEIDKLTRDEKMDLLKLFFAESKWDPTHEFDHAVNSTYQGAWPNESWNKLFNNQGTEAGDKFCGIALKQLFKNAASAYEKGVLDETDKAAAKKMQPVADLFDKVGEMIKDYAHKETRFSLYNLFNDRYVRVCAKEIAERSLGDKADGRTSEIIAQTIITFREEYIVKVYYRYARKYMNKYYPFYARYGIDSRAWHLANTFIHSIQRCMTMEETAPKVERWLLGVELADEIKPGIAKLFPDLSESGIDQLLAEVKKADLVRFPAYLAERCILPDPVWAHLRDAVELFLAFERRDSNLVHFMEARNQANPATPGQKAFLDYVAQLIEVGKKPTDLQKAQALRDFINILRYQEDTPDPTQPSDAFSLNIGRETQLQFKMYRILFQKGAWAFIKFYFWSILRALPLIGTNSGKTYAQYKHGGKKFGKPLPWRNAHSRNEALAAWTDKLGIGLAQEIGRIQLMGRDYLHQFNAIQPLTLHASLRDLVGEENLQAMRYSVEQIVFDRWLSGDLSFQQALPVRRGIEEIVDEVLEEMIQNHLPKEYRGLKPGTIGFMKYKIAEIIEEKLKRSCRYMPNALVNGLAWIFAHEMEGLEYIGAQGILGYLSEQVTPTPEKSRMRFADWIKRSPEAREQRPGSIPLPELRKSDGQNRKRFFDWIRQARLAEMRTTLSEETNSLKELIESSALSARTSITMEKSVINDVVIDPAPKLKAFARKYRRKFAYHSWSRKFIVKGPMTEQEKTELLALADSVPQIAGNEKLARKYKKHIKRLFKAAKKAPVNTITGGYIGFNPGDDFINNTLPRDKFSFNPWTKELRVNGPMTKEERKALEEIAEKEAVKAIMKKYTDKIEDAKGGLFAASQPNKKFDTLLADIKKVIDKGVGSIETNKGYLNNLWELYWEAVETVLGKKDQYFYAATRLKIDPFSVPWPRRIEGIEKRDFENNADLAGKGRKNKAVTRHIQRIVALLAAQRYITDELKRSLRAVQHPNFKAGFALESYTAQSLAETLVDEYLKGYINSPQEAREYILSHIEAIFKNAFFGELGPDEFFFKADKRPSAAVLKSALEKVIHLAHQHIIIEKDMGIMERRGSDD